MSDDLLALAKRCEKARGPDRGLDCDVAEAIGLKVVRNPRWFNEPQCFGPGSGRSRGRITVPSYTGSLDAALSLAPKEAWWKVDGFAGQPVTGKDAYHAQITFADRPHVWGIALSPAAALCAAALRSRASQAPATAPEE